jgi:hypothetical protein
MNPPINPGAGTLYASTFARAYAGRSRAAGIKAKCLECVGLVRADITNCGAAPTSEAPCPLWPYRPYRPEGGEDDDRGG